MRKAEPILLSPEERTTLKAWSNGRKFPLRMIQRAQIICLAADGVLSQDIAQKLQTSRPTIQLWRQRFLSLRLDGLKKDAPVQADFRESHNAKSTLSSKRLFTQLLPLQLIGAREQWPEPMG